MAEAIRWVCAGCGWQAPPDTLALRCGRSGGGDDTEHVLRRLLDPAALPADVDWRETFLAAADREPGASPFVRYRRLLSSYQRARAGGLSDADYVELAERLDRAVAAVAGHGLRTTPFAPSARLARAVGLDALWVKDETGNVGGSHKARHLIGLALALEVERRLGDDIAAPLAIASCGNAALAAAIVARAVERPLRVFVPPHADEAITEALARLAAEIAVCDRRSGEAGDPCLRRFRAAVAAGALPFTCQGPESALALEGGQTLAWEMVAEILRRGGRFDDRIDDLFVQVGGGALATAVVRGLEEARALGLLEAMPRLITVQTTGGWPLGRAWERLVERLLPDRKGGSTVAERAAVAREVRDRVPGAALEEALDHAASHRSEFMWPWEREPVSVAGGILDDETYDWLAVVEAMLRTGGFPIVASEESLLAAHRLARETTGVAVDPTGSAGLAGALELVEGCGAADRRAAVLFTGVERSTA